MSGDGSAYLGYGLVRLAHVLGRDLERRLAPLALTPTSFSALFHLARSPAVSAAALARAILVTPQSVGPLLDSLAEAGLVVRERGGTRGAIRSTVTPAGQQRLAEAQQIVQSLDAQLATHLSEFDRQKLAGLLHRTADSWPS